MTATATRDDCSFELSAEAITVRIRWFGLAVGYALVNFLGRESGATHAVVPEWLSNRQVLNGILTLGAIYAIADSYLSLRGRVFLSRVPMVISLMEALFIGLLCHFDEGLESPFRFYYFLSLLVCAFRYSRWITLSTFCLHAMSFTVLAFATSPHSPNDPTRVLLMLIWLGWVTWASTALAGLLQSAGKRLSFFNDELQKHQHELEQRIEDRTRELRESQAFVVQQEKQAAFGLLAAGIAHEVGNPLAGISSVIQLLNRRDVDDYTRERYQMVDDQLRRIQRTLRELIDFSRPATLERSQCDLQEVLEAALNIAKYYKRRKNKQIVTHYAEGLPKLNAVRDQLVQVFLNLILNAMDATAEGGTIEITTRRDEPWLRISIRDNGSGIAEAHRARLFQPYFTTKETGTGLGLFVCRLILERNDGRIELTDTSPSGTTFSVLLPSEAITHLQAASGLAPEVPTL
jgi:two-component system, NtrC family, sensor kinase